MIVNPRAFGATDRTPSITAIPGESPGRDGTSDTEEVSFVDALLRGDDEAFLRLVTAYHPRMLRLARTYLHDPGSAEEVVQETWLAVLRGLERFESRSSLRTRIFRILVNQARTRAVRDGRTITFSSTRAAADEESAVEPERFLGPDSRWPGHWSSLPADWESLPEDHYQSLETRTTIDAAIAALPEQQGEVIVLRDVEGWTAADVCNVLGISETNQRVLLHRARSKVRRALERSLERT